MDAIPPAGLPGRIEALSATLALARGLVRAGRRIDLSGLEEEVALLCRALAALPPAEASALRRPLTALLGEVEALAATLAAP